MIHTADARLRALITEQLAGVIDPCSRFNGTRLSFVDLGMVDSIDVTAPGRVRVRLLLDDPICTYMVEIHQTVREAVLQVEGIEHVDVEIVGDRLWAPDRMTAETTEKMRRWREIRLERATARMSNHPVLSESEQA